MLMLCGRSATGKTAIRNKLVEYYHYRPIITYTTRPMRFFERDGVDYHFISKREFKVLKFFGFFAETTEYKVANGDTWYYGTSKESLKDGNGVLIVNPDGLKNLNKYLKKKNINAFSVLIKSPMDVLKKRLENRGDNRDEIRRRMMADDKDFNRISYHVNSIVTNDGTKPLRIIAKQIMSEHSAYMKRKLIDKKKGDYDE